MPPPLPRRANPYAAPVEEGGLSLEIAVRVPEASMLTLRPRALLVAAVAANRSVSSSTQAAAGFLKTKAAPLLGFPES